MSDDFDPYFKWLAIPPEEQPPNHYRLLGVPLYVNDTDVISNAADQRMSHIRNYQSGRYSALSQKILNEIAAARGVLLDVGRKAGYDTDLRRRLAPASPPPMAGAAPPRNEPGAGQSGIRRGAKLAAQQSPSTILRGSQAAAVLPVEEDYVPPRPGSASDQAAQAASARATTTTRKMSPELQRSHAKFNRIAMVVVPALALGLTTLILFISGYFSHKDPPEVVVQPTPVAPAPPAPRHPAPKITDEGPELPDVPKHPVPRFDPPRPRPPDRPPRQTNTSGGPIGSGSNPAVPEGLGPPLHTETIAIDSKRSWTPIGPVGSSTLVVFKASGNWNLNTNVRDARWISGPEGNPRPPANGGLPLEGARMGALIGRVGGFTFLVGKSANVRILRGGILELACNEAPSLLADNNGQVTVNMSVYKSKGDSPEDDFATFPPGSSKRPEVPVAPPVEEEPPQKKAARLEKEKASAIDSGNISQAVALAGEIATLKKEDELKAKIETLDQIAQHASDASSNANVARQGVALAKEAIAQKRKDVAKRCAGIALVAARRGEDPTLLRQITLLVLEVQQL